MDASKHNIFTHKGVQIYNLFLLLIISNIAVEEENKLRNWVDVLIPVKKCSIKFVSETTNFRWISCYYIGENSFLLLHYIYHRKHYYNFRYLTNMLKMRLRDLTVLYCNVKGRLMQIWKLRICSYVPVQIKVIPWKFRVLNRRNCRVIHQ